MKTLPEDQATGLTKREYFAAMALQGLCSWNHNKNKMMCDYTRVSQEAIRYVEELIEELNKEQKE